MYSQPERITLTAEEAQALKARVQAAPLAEKDIKLLVGLISFNFWLQQQLATAKLSIQRLKRLFGFNTEKKVCKSYP